MRTWKGVEMRCLPHWVYACYVTLGVVWVSGWMWSRSSFLQTPNFSIWTFVTNDPLFPLTSAHKGIAGNEKADEWGEGCGARSQRQTLEEAFARVSAQSE